MKQSIIRVARKLPLRIRNSLFHLAFNVAPAEARKFAFEYLDAPDMEGGLRLFAKQGFHPNTIIDVGAYRGSWTKLASTIWPNANLIMFEPNAAREPECRNTAETLKATLFEKLLGAKHGEVVEFNVMANGSAIFGERSPVPRTVEKLELSTLDNCLGSFKPPALLKIDAQGYELEILKGASTILPKVEAILLEVSIIEINEGAPLLKEVAVFMAQLGFVTYDIVEIHRRPLDRALNQIDVIFVRSTSKFLSDKRHYSEG